MNSRSRDYQIQAVKAEVGWAYPQLKMLPPEEAGNAASERSRLVGLVEGKVNSSYRQNKLHLGKLSPGCSCCGDGTWSCLFLNGLCTANCFFCPQDRGMKQERPPAADSIVFTDPRDYAAYVQKLNIKGVSFSGGESLLEYKKLLSFIDALRNRLGSKVYLWMYSNGDLVDGDKMKGLKQAGLNEIRFNIAARNYGLKAVEIAVRFIETVSVEIPAIPEDFETVKDSLALVAHSGVKYLNLHQMLATQYNYKTLADRGYTFLHQAGLPTLESEITALKLLQFAAENEINLPVNYCSQAYKFRLQGRGHRIRAASLLANSYEEITDYGYIRNISIQEPGAIKKLGGRLKAAGYDGTRWCEGPQGIAIHFSLVPFLSEEGCRFNLAYLEPHLRDAGNGSKVTGDERDFASAEQYIKPTVERGAGEVELARLELDSGRFINAATTVVAEYRNISGTAIMGLKKHYIDREDPRETMKWFVDNYDMTAPEKIQQMAREKAILGEADNWEQVPSGLSDIF